jgi:antitoxin component YwqK of YwqJK toxin-antitoxin module
MRLHSKINTALLSLLCACFLTCCQNAQEKENNTQTDQSNSNKVSKSSDSTLVFEQIKYPDGALKMEGNSIRGIKEGKWTSFYQDGMIWSETHFEKGIKNGPTSTWYPNGIKRYEGFFKNDQQHGDWIFYDETGKISKKQSFK